MRQSTDWMDATHIGPGGEFLSPAEYAAMRRRERGGGRRALIALLVIAAVLGGAWEGFIRSPLYRQLDPIQVPRVLWLYVLPGQFFTPTDVALWSINLGTRGKIRDLAKILLDPTPAMSARNGKPLAILDPGKIGIIWRQVSPTVLGGPHVRVAEVRLTGTVERDGTRTDVWTQAWDVWLVDTKVGWKLFHNTNIGAWKNGCPADCVRGMKPQSVAQLLANYQTWSGKSMVPIPGVGAP